MSLMTELFADIYARQDNRMTRLDARVKWIGAAALLVAVISSAKPVLPLAVLVIGLTGTLLADVPVRWIVMRLVPPLGVAGMLAVLQTWLNGVPWAVSLTLAARVLGAVSVMLWLSVVTPAHRLFQALGALGMPRAWVEVALLMYRYAFVFLDFAEDTITAQRVRLGYAGFRRGLSSAGIAAGTVLVRAVDQAERTGEAMRTRGYIGALPFAPLPALARRDWLALAGTLAAVAASFWWLEGR